MSTTKIAIEPKELLDLAESAITRLQQEVELHRTRHKDGGGNCADFVHENKMLGVVFGVSLACRIMLGQADDDLAILRLQKASRDWDRTYVPSQLERLELALTEHRVAMANAYKDAGVPESLKTDPAVHYLVGYAYTDGVLDALKIQRGGVSEGKLMDMVERAKRTAEVANMMAAENRAKQAQAQPAETAG